MSFVQAYKRTKTYVHQFPDVKLVFEPNEKGDVVCDVAEQGVVDRLLQTPTGFRLYGEQVDAPMAPILVEQVPIDQRKVEQVPPAEGESPYILRGEEADTVLDLRPLSDAELHAFAEANGIKVHSKAKGDTIRDKIVEFLNSEG